MIIIYKGSCNIQVKKTLINDSDLLNKVFHSPALLTNSRIFPVFYIPDLFMIKYLVPPPPPFFKVPTLCPSIKITNPGNAPAHCLLKTSPLPPHVKFQRQVQQLAAAYFKQIRKCFIRKREAECLKLVLLFVCLIHHLHSTSFSLFRSSSSFFFRVSLSLFSDSRVSPFWSP